MTMAARASANMAASSVNHVSLTMAALLLVLVVCQGWAIRRPRPDADGSSSARASQPGSRSPSGGWTMKNGVWWRPGLPYPVEISPVRWDQLPQSASQVPRHGGSGSELHVEPQVIDVGDSVTVWGWTPAGPVEPQRHADSDGEDGIFPPHGDIIAVYCPSSAKDGDYLDYWEIAAGQSSKVFGPLINMRCDYEFRYLLQDSNGTYRFAAASTPVTFTAGVSMPTGGRISESGRHGDMNVMWVSAHSEPSTVQLLDAGSNETRTFSGSSRSYEANDMCNHPANVTSSVLFRDPGHIHLVLLTDLTPSTEYTYRFGSHDSWSPPHSFKTAPAVDSQEPVSFFVFGDLGVERSPIGKPTSNRAFTTIQRIQAEMEAKPYNFILHVGDISYAEGQGFLWEQFGHLIQPVATALPYYVGIGNHDYDHEAGGSKDPSHAPGQGYHPSWGVYGDDSGGECAVPVVNRFQMPSTSRGSRPPFWYSHDYGMVHMLWLSTEHDFYPGSEMHDFMVSDLEAVNRTRTPWVFLMGHRPMYCSRAIDEITSKDNYVVQLHQRQAYEAVLRRYSVDVFVAGHYHAYERTCPVYNGTCRTAGDGRAAATVHLLLGTAGASQDFDRWDEHAWSERRAVAYGYGRVHVRNATHLRLEYVINGNGTAADSAWLVSSHDWGRA